MLPLVFCLLFLAVQGRSVDYPEETNCGYKSCHPIKEGFVNVHLVPHTHDDVGWLKTVDQYYYGSNTKFQYAGVQYILDSVFQELKKDPKKRFIYVETAFFWKWWKQQDDATRHQMKKLVNNGQLEFIGGAWSMNDEAASNYQSIIDQFTWGLRKLNDTFGECGRPKIGWQIDPFGHSKEMASIFAQLGFDGVFLGRIDYQDKHRRFKNKQAEMVWQGNPTLGDSSNIYTGVLYNTYGPPPGLCFDIFCQDDPIIDDKKSPDYNVDSRLDDLFAYLNNVTKVYTTNNVLITMGSDFHYQDAHVWYKNLDKLIKYGNARNDSRYNLLYSTPSCYLKAVHEEGKDKEWPTKEDDFFPYASDPHSYWTGYFTSRPTSKRFERDGNNFLQVCKQLAVLADIDNEVDLSALREAMGVMQHHDAITGTEKQHVANDYHRILYDGFEKCGQLASEALNKLIANKSEDIPFQSCLLRNISSCPISETNDNFIVTVYNPSNVFDEGEELVRLPVTGQNYTVTDMNGREVEVELIPIPDPVLNIPGRKSNATAELIFVARISALGSSSYTVKKVSGNKVLTASNLTELSNKMISIKVDELGLLSEISMAILGPINVKQTFAYYKGFVGNNSVFSNRSSGAYIFRPTGPARPSIEKVNITVYDGDLVKEIHQTFNDFTSQIIRINKFSPVVEFQWLVGPLPDSKQNGIEVVSLFQTNLTNKGKFFTDLNGRQILTRTRNVRPTWNLNLTEPISGNYYPVNSRIGFVDEGQNIRVVVFNDRAQGGSSLHDGELELMVHRKCIHDDAFGVGEPLMETAYDQGLVVRGTHYLLIENITSLEFIKPNDMEQMYAEWLLLQPWVFLSPAVENVQDFSGISSEIPWLNILTLEPWKEQSVLLRLENLLENALPNITFIVDLKKLFTKFDVTAVRETTLGANQWLSDNERFEFKTNTGVKNKRATTITAESDFEIILNPRQIRTFIIDVQRK